MNLEVVCVAPARVSGSNLNRLGHKQLNTVYREEIPIGLRAGEGFRSTINGKRKDTPLGSARGRERGKLGFWSQKIEGGNQR